MAERNSLTFSFNHYNYGRDLYIYEIYKLLLQLSDQGSYTNAENSETFLKPKRLKFILTIWESMAEPLVNTLKLFEA